MSLKDQIELYTNETALTKIAEDLASKNYPAHWYQEQINAWLGIVMEFGDNDAEAKMTFSYLVQNVFRATEEQQVQKTELLLKSREQAKKFIADHPYIFTSHNEDGSSDKPKTVGSKKERAAAIYKAKIAEGRTAVVNAFVEQLEMSRAGAGTYYINFKNGTWEL